MDGSFESIEMEEVACMLCDGKRSLCAGQVASHGVEFHYRLCADCGLKYMNPRPTKAWYEAHYARQFWEYKQANRSWRDQDKRWRLRDVFKRDKSGRKRHQSSRLDILIPLIEESATISSRSYVLDIGCAYGAIGAGLHRHFGCEVWGVEPNATAREVAKTESGIKILADTAEDLDACSAFNGKFDLILMSNVLENILDPKPIIASCRKLLSASGVMCVHMPNFFFYDAMNPYHPYIYSPETLSRLQGCEGINVFKTQARVCDPMASGPFVKADQFVTTFAKPGGNGESVFQTPDPQRLLKLQNECLKLALERRPVWQGVFGRQSAGG